MKEKINLELGKIAKIRPNTTSGILGYNVKVDQFFDQLTVSHIDFISQSIYSAPY